MPEMNGIPVLMVEEDTLPAAWERAVIEVWRNGIAVKTEYDKPADPPSKDSTMIIVIREPLKEPRIHRAFPGSLEDLEVYRQEVLLGIHDHWIRPEEGKWTYTYHKRLFDYEMEDERIDQIDSIIQKLAEVPYSRRAQAVTWNVKLDAPTDDPPCLQRLWFRMTQDDGGRYRLNLNTHWRSRDAFKASFMNIFALTDLQRMVAGRISEVRGDDVTVGRYVDISDSFHIYGSYHAEFRNFLQTVEKRSFEDRVWPTGFAEPFFEEAKRKIAHELGGSPKA